MVNRTARCCASRDCAPARGVTRTSRANPTAIVVGNVKANVVSAVVPMIAVSMTVVLDCLYTGNFSVSLSTGSVDANLCNVNVTTINVLSALNVALTASTCKPVTSGTNNGTRVDKLNGRIHRHASTLSTLNGAATTANGNFTVNSTTLATLTLLTSCVRRVGVTVVHTISGNGRCLSTTNGIFSPAGTDAVSFVRFFRIGLVGPGILIKTFLKTVTTFLFYNLAVNTMNHTTRSVIRRIHHRFHRVGNVLRNGTAPSCNHYIRVDAHDTRHRVVIPSLLTVIVPVIINLILNMTNILNLLANNLTTNFALTIFVSGSNNT